MNEKSTNGGCFGCAERVHLGQGEGGSQNKKLSVVIVCHHMERVEGCDIQ